MEVQPLNFFFIHIQHIRQLRRGRLSMLLADRKLVGTCGFVGWSIRDARAEIGFALSRKYWGRGLMTEAVREIISFGFREMKLNRIQGNCEVENPASARVMEKASMK